MTVLNDPRMEVSAYPLIVFVHIPKTAGSTLKKFLRVCTPRGDGDVDRIAENSNELLDVARKSDWISGHLSRETLAKSLIWLDRPIEYFSVVREPVDQLISHLNFSIHRSYGANYHDSHSDPEKLLDTEVLATDFSECSAVIDFLLRNSQRYLNIQSEMILGNDYPVISKEEIMRRLATYTFIANEFSLLKIYNSFGFAQIHEESEKIRENVAVRHINKQIFSSPELKQFLAEHHRHDLQLYATLRHATWPAERRRSFRPALLGREVFTYENFDEQAYLYSNPDVAAAVCQGGLESGFAHFSTFGYGEERMNRRWVFAPA